MESNHPIFIITLGRTGSKMLRYLINSNSEINISPEIHFKSLIYYDFYQRSKKYFGNNINKQNINFLLDYLYKEKFYGYFWKNLAEKKKTNFLGYKNIKADLLQSDINYKTIFKVLLQNDALENNKKKWGAKAPFQIFFFQSLFKMFPEGKYINLIRDPRAIISSYLHKKEFYFILEKKIWFFAKKKSVLKLIIILYVSIMIHFSLLFHFFYRNHLNYFCIKYEDIVQKNNIFKNLLKYLRIKKKIEDIKFPKQIGKSYNTESKKIGNSNDKWKSYLNFYQKFIIYFLNFIPGKVFNYF